MHNVFNQLADLEQRAGITEAESAAVIGISASTVRRWRAGHNIPEWVEPAMTVLLSHETATLRQLVKDRLK